MGDINSASMLRDNVSDCNNGNINNNIDINSVFIELSEDSINTETNQKLNVFIHSQLKSSIGVRKYLYYVQNAVFAVFNKSILAVISNNKEYTEDIYEQFDAQIRKIVYNTWKKANILIKYYYYDNNYSNSDTITNGDNSNTRKERLNELTFGKTFTEKPVSEVIYFNEHTHKQTFDNFVSSEENLTALEVCQSIVCYSRKELVCGGSIVFLYGETSTGKTHLLNAMCDFYREKGGKIFNISATNFLRQYVDTVRKQKTFMFRDNILDNEIIMIDDIDDLIGKNGTLHELQKLITMAVDEKKYIVLTSKILPNLLSEKGNDFKSILSNAISLKLKTQQNALKANIAMNYICEKNMNVPISIVRDLIANLNCSSRELKNYIKKLAITQSIHKFELNTNLALQILSDDIEKHNSNKSVFHANEEEIIDVVANYYHLSSSDIVSKIKCTAICRARNVVMYLMKQLNSANFQEIGRALNRNHSTVISGLKNVNVWLEKDKKFPAELADIMAKFKKH